MTYLTGSAIQDLVDRDGATPSKAAIDRFLEAHQFPIVEEGRTTFVFRGKVDEVLLRHWIFGLPSAQPLLRVGSSNLWYLTIELPGSSRVEYKFELVKKDLRRWVRDPLNPRRAFDPYGSNSVLQTTGYEYPTWCEPDPEAREGHLEDMTLPSREFGDTRQVTVYLPARFRRRRIYPLLVVHDGGDYLRYSQMKTVLDNLIHRLEIPPMVVALSHPEKRLDEYPDDPRHARFLTEELVPHLERRLPLTNDPRLRGLMGASFGAVATLATAFRYPGFFGRLLLQSGSFAFTDIGNHQRSPVFDPVVSFVNRFRARPTRVAQKVFVSCGVYESLIYENRSIIPILQATGMEVRFVESRDGHNWESWRDRLREGLSWLFPGPLWMVYE